MTRMEAEFSFFKAGQGSFYGGRIWDQKTSQVFTVVYDCGTTPRIAGNNQSLNDEIDYFKSRPQFYTPNNNDIELLFISHLDYDHVSGLKRLLNEYKVKNIILPYIEKEYRQFFLTSISNGDDIDGELPIDIDEYISFIESPNKFINDNSNSEKPKIFFVTSNKEEIEYLGYSNDEGEGVYPRGTQPDYDIEEFNGQTNVFVYKNNLQFFIKQYWEFTTYVQSVNKDATDKLHACLKNKKILNKPASYNLSIDDLKEIVKQKRKEASDCYKKYIGNINSHGLVLLHGPIEFKHLCSQIYSNCELSSIHNDYHYHYPCHYCEGYSFDNNTKPMLGTLLFGDTSINPKNNQIIFPKKFKDKLVNVHVVQVPHHGSEKNWDITAFNKLKIGANINRWTYQVVAVCNFGFVNKFGHPSHQVLNDLKSTIFLNTQFSRLNIRYDIHY